MSNRNKVVWSIAAAWLTLAFFTWLSLSQPPEIAVLHAMSEETGRDSFMTDRTIDVHGATEEQMARIELAVKRFDDLGLRLPPLEVHFSTSTDGCDGLVGKFSAGTTPWRIGICSPDLEWVYEHELAHAWEQENLTDVLRGEFMESHGLNVWASHDVPWNERGKEWVAVVIQQGLNGVPLPPVLSDDAKSRMRAFELLTGNVAPVLIDWIEEREVPCSDRPTELSGRIDDGSGRTCDRTEGRRLR